MGPIWQNPVVTPKNNCLKKRLLNYLNISSLLKYWLQKKKKEINNVSSILTQHKVYQLMCKSATPTLPESLILSKGWIYVSKIWRLQTLVMPTLFAKNLSKFKITFFSFHNSHHRNKLFYNRYGHIFRPFNDIQNDRKIFVLVKEIFCSSLQFTTKQTWKYKENSCITSF